MTYEKMYSRCFETLKDPLNIETEPKRIATILKTIKNGFGDVCFEWKQYREKKVRVAYYNIPCSFDIETTAGRLGSYMYFWQFNIAGYTIYGRTWYSFEILIRYLNAVFDLTKIKLICYIQNINYEYQFLRVRYKDNINRVFATKKRNIIYFQMFNIEFRDSYILFGCSLEKIGKDLKTFPFRKSHDLDYSKLRNSKTQLTQKEIKYCLLDVIVLSCAIFEKIQQHKYIYNIPLTKTGYTRKYIREFLHRDKDFQRVVKNLKLTVETYEQMRRAFAGGFSHGNAHRNGVAIKNCLSADECSEYPACELLYMYPMKYIGNYDELRKIDKQRLIDGKICYIADFTFTKIRPKQNVVDNIISYSKCKITGNFKLNNGRVICAEELCISATNVDFEMFEKFYDWETVTIKNYNVYLLGYLPKSLLIAVVELFKKKNTLKNIKQEAENYKLAKELLNSNYGAMVESVLKLFYEFDDSTGDLIISPNNFEEQIEKYNDSNKRFNFYLWGVFITSYARRDLFYIFDDMRTAGIPEKYLLSDTDSIKFEDCPEMHEILKKHNARKLELLNRTIDTMKLDEYREILNKYKLGGFEIDDKYLIFKQFGAKRYVGISSDYELHATIAGLPKKATDNFIRKYGKYKTFELFKKNVTFGCDDSCKLTHYYIDEPQTEIIDGEEMTEFSSIVLQNTSFKMTYAQEFSRFVEYLKSHDLNELILKTFDKEKISDTI